MPPRRPNSQKNARGSGSASSKTARGSAAGPSKGARKGPAKSSQKAPSKRLGKGQPAAKSTANPTASPDEQRLQKVLAAAGIASRRECELLIEEGRVTVDGAVVTELGVKVNPGTQTIHVDGELLPQKRRVYFAVNKPEGVVCTAKDPSGRPRVTDLLPPDLGRVFNVGRLDMASEGLILLTNDGELANKLTHPRHGVEKVYHVQVMGSPTAETLAQLRKGVYLAEGHAHFVNGKVKTRKKNSTILEVVLDEGRNREIRRVLARVGHKVQRLTRIAVGPVRLGELPSGAYRPLTSVELQALKKAAVAGPKDDSAGTKARPKRRRSAKPTGKSPAKPAFSKGTGRRVIGEAGDAPSAASKRATKKPDGRSSSGDRRATPKAAGTRGTTGKPSKTGGRNATGNKTATSARSASAPKKPTGKKTIGKKKVASKGLDARKGLGTRKTTGKPAGKKSGKAAGKPAGKPAGKKLAKGRPTKGKPKGKPKGRGRAS